MLAIFMLDWFLFFAAIIIYVAIAILNTTLNVTTFAGSSLIQVFLLKINIVNSAFLGFFVGIFLFVANRFIDMEEVDIHMDFVVHPAICLLIGLAVFIITLLIQRTTVGFWIFAIIFSLGWAFLLAGLIYLKTKDLTWFWILFGLGTIVNLNSHLRARKYRINIDATLANSANNESTNNE